MDLAARLAVGVFLLTAAAGKVRARGGFADVLGAYGVPSTVRRPAGVGLIAAEAVLGALLLGGLVVRPAAVAAGGLGVVFTLALASARLRGHRTLRCGCFGADERPTAVLIARSLAYTVLCGLAALGEVAPPTPSRETVVLLILAALAVAVVVLAALVLALYRQVGVLSLRIAPRAALELAEEGPSLRAPAPSLAGLARAGTELVAFVSGDCRLCRELAPAVRALTREGVRVRVVDEVEDRSAFDRWNVPGTPFVVLIVDGAVAAKGLVNTLEQLDEVIALGTARSERAAA